MIEFFLKLFILNFFLLGNNFFVSKEKNLLFKYFGWFCKEKCDIKVDNLVFKFKFVFMGMRLLCVFF